jgi:hypothetical protein
MMLRINGYAHRLAQRGKLGGHTLKLALFHLEENRQQQQILI